MKFKLELSNIFWWLWVITLAFIVAAVAGWRLGYYAVMAVSAFQIIVFLTRERSLMSFPTQIRFAYFALSLLGLWVLMRLPFYLLLLLATIMVVFFGRCSLSLILKHMPWNRDRAPRLY